MLLSPLSNNGGSYPRISSSQNIILQCIRNTIVYVVWKILTKDRERNEPKPRQWIRAPDYSEHCHPNHGLSMLNEITLFERIPVPDFSKY